MDAHSRAAMYAMRNFYRNDIVKFLWWCHLKKIKMASSKKEFSLFDDSQDESAQSQSLDSLQTIISIKPLKIAPSTGFIFNVLPQKADAVFLLDSSM
jgi:hypothetical protein